jgi:hypothetical protein
MIPVVLEDGAIKVQKTDTLLYWQNAHFWISHPWAMMCTSTPCFDICFQVHSGAPTFHHLWQSVARSLSSPYCCKNCMHVSVCDHLHSTGSSFGTHLTQILWYRGPCEWWNMQIHSYIKLVSCISDSNHLPSWTWALTCRSSSTISEVVRWPKQSSSMMLVLPLWKLSTHSHIFLCVI